jgi:hypothetical protein
MLPTVVPVGQEAGDVTAPVFRQMAMPVHVMPRVLGATLAEDCPQEEVLRQVWHALPALRANQATPTGFEPVLQP